MIAPELTPECARFCFALLLRMLCTLQWNAASGRSAVHPPSGVSPVKFDQCDHSIQPPWMGTRVAPRNMLACALQPFRRGP